MLKVVAAKSLHFGSCESPSGCGADTRPSSSINTKPLTLFLSLWRCGKRSFSLYVCHIFRCWLASFSYTICHIPVMLALFSYAMQSSKGVCF